MATVKCQNLENGSSWMNSKIRKVLRIEIAAGGHKKFRKDDEKK